MEFKPLIFLNMHYKLVCVVGWLVGWLAGWLFNLAPKPLQNCTEHNAYTERNGHTLWLTTE